MQCFVCFLLKAVVFAFLQLLTSCVNYAMDIQFLAYFRSAVPTFNLLVLGVNKTCYMKVHGIYIYNCMTLDYNSACSY